MGQVVRKNFLDNNVVLPVYNNGLVPDNSVAVRVYAGLDCNVLVRNNYAKKGH